MSRPDMQPVSRSHVRRFGLRPGFLAGVNSPTVDLYFGFSCSDWLEEGRIHQIGPTTFKAGETLIVFRHAAGVSRLPKHRRLIYLIDDDIRAGLRDPGVPALYRAKLMVLERPAAWSLEERADVVITTSTVLAERLQSRLPAKRIEQLAPFWPVEAVPSSSLEGRANRVALLMGRSHAHDAAPLMPVLEEALSRHGSMHLTLSGNLSVPASIARHPRVKLLPALGWRDYWQWLRSARFDIGLVPHLCASAFNRARSASKLGEYAMTGAAVLASDSWIAGAEAAKEGRCLLVSDRPEAWAAALEKLLADPNIAARIAARNRETLANSDTAALQRRLWGDLLGFG